MPLFWGDFLANTMHLSAQEIGAYLLLIAHLWENRGVVETDIGSLRRISRVRSDHWPRVWERLFPFFVVEQSGSLYSVSHARVLHEVLRAGEISRKRKAAALQMHSKCIAHAHANADAKRLQTVGNYQVSKKASFLGENQRRSKIAEISSVRSEDEEPKQEAADK